MATAGLLHGLTIRPNVPITYTISSNGSNGSLVGLVTTEFHACYLLGGAG